ncbi:hypothetical protein [Microbacterium sp. A84]|uniref:hypothetical protein n=1 Tax=Microbacterium sp. A84 TaxID=3450715 RepID=UPI003F433076
MTSFALSLTALVLIALLLGVHLTGYFALNPALRMMDASVYIPVKRAIDLTAPRLAKPLMLSCLAVTAAALIAAAFTGAVIVVAADAVTLAALVLVLLAILRGDLPINRGMASWSADEPPAEWRTIRARWERFFGLRVAANTLALLTSGFAVVIGAMGLA